ncbi:hypothetical protein [Pseudomonas sp.]|uniref:hypothetical protein n=1 Tax=Pseudomonas sp. TaxID=306 RepID=UPI0027314248|nr:hypothetical protein [Pseudomonas sp.]MDP2244015.1 hypothetical protein [Pseudomonas sp.]
MSEMQASPDACPKCGVIYSNADASVGRGSYRSKSGERSRSAISKIIVVIVLAGAAIGGWKFYQYRQVLAAVEEQVRLTSAYVTQIVTALDEGGSITFSEFFEKANKGVAEIDASMVQVSVLEPSAEASAAAIVYMKKSQEVIRGTARSMRSLLDLTTAKKREDKASDDRLSSNEYVRERASESRLSALDAQLKALNDLKESRTSLAVVANELRAAGSEIHGISGSALLSPPIYERLTNFNK